MAYNPMLNMLSLNGGYGLYGINGNNNESFFNAQMGSQIGSWIGQLLNGCICYAAAPGTNGGSSSSKKANDDKCDYADRATEQKEKPEDAVKRLLSSDVYNKLSDDLKADIASKYNLLKNVRKLDDTEITNRLNKYIEATQDKKQETVTNFVKTTLENNGITNPCDVVVADIVEKHNLIELFNPASTPEDKALLEKRIVDYAKGIEWGAAELGLAKGSIDPESPGTTFVDKEIEAAKAGNDTEAYRKAHLQLGQEVVELYDNINPNGVIGLDEFTAYQLHLTGSSYGVEVPLNDEIQAYIKKEFDMLDIDGNGYLDQKEMAVDTWTGMVINDTQDSKTSHDFTQEEFNTLKAGKEAFATVLIMNGKTVEEFEKLSTQEQQQLVTSTLNKAQQAVFNKYIATRNNGIKAFMLPKTNATTGS